MKKRVVWPRFITMRAVRLALIGLPLAALLPGQSMFRGDPAHTGVYPGPGPRQLHGVKWKFATGDRIVSSPVWHEGVVYVGSDDKNVYAVDAATGRQLWKFATAGPVPSTPAIAGGIVYFTSYDGKFYAVDARTGKLRWKFATGGERRFEAKGIHGLQPKNQTIADPWDVYLSSPVVTQGAVHFGSGDGNVYALDAASGELRWKFPTGDAVHASPAFDAGTLYFGSWDSYFYAVDAASGKEKWRLHGGNLIAVLRRSSHAAKHADPFSILTAATGGTLLHFRKQKEFEYAIATIGIELRSAYLLSYYPDSSESGYHTVKIEVDARGAKAFSRPGYWLSAN